LIRWVSDKPVERVAVLRFCRFLPNARLQSDVLDSVKTTVKAARRMGSGCGGKPAVFCFTGSETCAARKLSLS
jgi:hypothetical protein